jgi:hypothetical protein
VALNASRDERDVAALVIARTDRKAWRHGFAFLRHDL